VLAVATPGSIKFDHEDMGLLVFLDEVVDGGVVEGDNTGVLRFVSGVFHALRLLLLPLFSRLIAHIAGFRAVVEHVLVILPAAVSAHVTFPHWAVPGEILALEGSVGADLDVGHPKNKGEGEEKDGGGGGGGVDGHGHVLMMAIYG